MCGILGILNTGKKISDVTLRRMIEQLRHRGPNAFGSSIELNGRLGIGHTRLKLVDQSDLANQPMSFDEYLLSFNGEIYNHQELRQEIERLGGEFSTNCDSEVIIRAVQTWGFDRAIKKFNGCFGFLLFDRKKKIFYIVRDPIGKKQIVYCKATNGDWLFASEIKPFLSHPFFKAAPNINRFLSDLVFKFFSDRSETYFKDVYFLPAGHYIYFDLKKEDAQLNLIKYSDLIDTMVDRQSDADIETTLTELQELLTDSVRLRMSADCEVGSILSGGLDSSIITKLAADFHKTKFDKPFQCITSDYQDYVNRDLLNAKRLCDEIGGVALNKVVIENNVTVDEVDAITYALEEPLLDKVYFAQYMNYAKAKELGLRAVINGQGADELWLGYLFFYKLFSLPEAGINYDNLIRFWENQFQFYRLDVSGKTKNLIREIVVNNLDKNFLPHDELSGLDSLINFSVRTHLSAMFTQEDRLSMSHGVEVRLPHVDFRIFKMALSLPAKVKIKDGREKYILRMLGEKFLPEEIVQRKKLAFPDPPTPYDRKTEAIFNKKELLSSQILGEIFDSALAKWNLPEFNKMPIRVRWMLLAISRMEKVFFA